MIKLKKIIKESAWDRKFGESLPTLKDVTEKHQTESKEQLNEWGDLQAHVHRVKSHLAVFKQNIDRSPCHVLVNTHVTYSCHVAKVKCVVNGGIGDMKILSNLCLQTGCGAALHPPSFWLYTLWR